jgi:hypothetical protein
MNTNNSTRVAPPKQPLPGRSCGGCVLCCKLLGVPEIEKLKGDWCPHCKRGVGCRIYESRPEGCRIFLCGWLVNPRFGPEWKPDRSKMIITVAQDGNGLDFQCDPGFPQAWRKEPYHAQIVRLATVAADEGGRITITVGRRMTIISPSGELPLGEVGEGDELVCEYSGKLIVGARLVKAGSGV